MLSFHCFCLGKGQSVSEEEEEEEGKDFPACKAAVEWFLLPASVGRWGGPAAPPGLFLDQTACTSADLPQQDGGVWAPGSHPDLLSPLRDLHLLA